MDLKIRSIYPELCDGLKVTPEMISYLLDSDRSLLPISLTNICTINSCTDRVNKLLDFIIKRSTSLETCNAFIKTLVYYNYDEFAKILDLKLAEHYIKLRPKFSYELSELLN